MGMVYVRKDAQELPIDVFYGRGESRREVLALYCDVLMVSAECVRLTYRLSLERPRLPSNFESMS